MKNSGIKKQLAVGFGLASALLLAFGWLLYENWQELHTSNEWVNHTHTVIARLNDVLFRVQRLESDQRGYIIVGNTSFIAHFSESEKTLNRQVEELQELVKDNPVQVRQVAEMSLLVDQKLQFMDETIQMVQTHGFNKVRPRIAIERGKILMDQLVNVTRRMQTVEQRLLVVRDKSANEHARNLVVISLLVSMVIMLILAFLYNLINRTLQEREQMNRALRDEITERRQIESDLIRTQQMALQATRAKSEFLAMMSHEIRTPMNGVIGMTGLLMETELDSEQLEYAQTIRKSGESLISLINDLLDFSKIESGRLELEEVQFNLLTCIEDVVDLMAPQVANRSLALFYEIRNGVPRMLYGDVTRLRQVLVNLMSNAVKFTENGYISLTVELVQQKNEEVELQFSVQDTGIGIPPDKLERVFEAFSQADSSTTRKYGGTGLGLAISKQIVEQMKGRFWLESQVGQGTTFFFTMKAQHNAECLLPMETATLRGKSVLLLESNVMQRELLTRLMSEQWAIEVIACATPKEAQDQLNNGLKPDIVVLDFDWFDEALMHAIDRSDAPLLVEASYTQGTQAKTLFSEQQILFKPLRHSQLKTLLLQTLMSPTGESGVTTQLVQGSLDPELARKYPLHILVAEDHPVNQKLAQALLEKMGYLPDMAGNGLEAVQALESKRYDLIFMDVQMPEMDGLEATRQIIRRWPGEDRPVIIAMTAYASQGDKASCLNIGMQDFLRKPVLKEELQAILIKWGRIIQSKSHPADSVSALTGPGGEEKDPVNGLIDMDMLRERVDQDEELLQALLMMFLEECPNSLEKIRHALAAHQIEELHSLSHTLKGMCQNLSIQSMQTVAAQMEQASRNPAQCDESEFLAMLRKLEHDFEQIRQQVGTELGAIQAS